MLDKRLSACRDLVSGDVACDVGTDHGYLAAELLKTGKCRFCYACDVNEQPLKAAERTLSRLNMDDKWKCILSDGLTVPDSMDISNITDVICAGMGGELIAKIIGVSDIAKKSQLILQPMTQAAYLRSFLCENGFHIQKEIPVDDGKHIYTVISAVYDGVIRSISEKERLFGFCLENEPDYKAYINQTAGRILKAAEGMLKSDPTSEEGDRLKKIAEEILK